jgi:phage protein D
LSVRRSDNEVAATFILRNGADELIDISGFDGAEIRLQLGAADELTLDLPAQMPNGIWRNDLPIWQVGATLKVYAGYASDVSLMQQFEIVSTTVNYEDSETMVIRGVSPLARAARNTEPRTFQSADDADIVATIAAEYGWTFTPDGDELWLNPAERLKESGTSDLDLLKLIALEARLGGPRVTSNGALVMPTAKIGFLKYARGIPPDGDEWRRLHSLGMNRDGATVLTVAVVSWDPGTQQFIQVEFQADEFGGDPKVVYHGPPSVRPLQFDSTTQGLTLAVIEYNTGRRAMRERVDVLAAGLFLNESNATDLAKRWFELREKLSRWADADVDGHPLLLPYESITLGGALANVDKGVWLPMTVTHKFGGDGWTATPRLIRVVDEAITTAVEFGTREIDVAPVDENSFVNDDFENMA